MPDQLNIPQVEETNLYTSAVSVPKLAERLGVSVTTAWMWVWENKIQSVKIGHRVLIPESAIYEFLNDAPSASKVEV